MGPKGGLASVIVLSYNGKDYLEACLSSILASEYGDREVIVVDNASQDGSASLVEGRFPQVRVVRNSRNLGYAGGMNRGIGEARGYFLAFLNQDTTVSPSWLGALVTALEGDPQVGMVGSKIYYPDGHTIQHGGGRIIYPQALADHYGYRQLDQGQWNEPQEVDYVTGAAFATRREVLEAIGPFDEGFHPAYFEDTDLCFRARAGGYKVLYVPGAVAIHHESATTVRDSDLYYRAYHTSRLRFLLKHYSPQQIAEDFFPSEAEWLGQVQSPQERRALKEAYLAASRWGSRGDLPGWTPVVGEGFNRLAVEALPGESALAGTPGRWGWLRSLLAR